MSIMSHISSWGGSLFQMVSNGDGTFTISKSTTPHYLVLPLYIARVDLNVLNKEFLDGYKIISISDFHKNYIEQLYDHDNLLHDDVRLPQVGQTINRPSAHYVLLKEVTLINDHTEAGRKKDDAIMNDEVQKLDLFISALRLLSSGSIHTHKVYFLSDVTHNNNVLKTSTSLYDINTWYRNTEKHCFWEQYDISADTLKSVGGIIENLQRTFDRFWLPMSYFNQYHSSYDLADKIIKLSIIWESTLLNGKRDELRYSLSVRGSYLLERDLGDILKTAYDIRSNIVHTGDVSPDVIKRVKRIIGEDGTAFDVLFKFVKIYLEPITRDILNGFLQKILDNNKGLSRIANELDGEIFSIIGNRCTRK
jgi:hypothetical protein